MTPARRPSARRPPGRDPADAIVFLLFLAVPLVASPRFWDQFTTVKWYTLQALAALWVAAECFWGGPWRAPSFVARTGRLVLPLAALAAFSLGRGGWGWALTPLGERLTVLALAWCVFRYARRSPQPLRWPAWGAGAATLVTNALGTAQVLGWQPLPALTASDGRSALFGNANMAAQFLGWAFVLLVVARPRRSRLSGFLPEALLAWTAAYLYFLSCRSVLIGLGLALAVLLALRRASPWSLLRIGVGAAGLVALLLSTGAAAAFLGDAREHKTLGAWQRVALWQSTLRLAKEHPLGIGSSNFTHAFPPYDLAGGLTRHQSVEYRHPHNEALRVLAEEGWTFTALALLLAARLLAALWRSRRVRRGRTEQGAFLLAAGAFLGVEGAFQFPLAVAFGALAFAFWLGLALASLEPLAARDESARGAPARWLRAVVPALAAAGIATGAARAAWSEYLFVNRAADRAAQAKACRLDARNLAACVTAAWLEAEAQPAAARARLLAVLARSPGYGPAVKLLGEVAMQGGEVETGCFYLWLFDELYRGASSVHTELTQSCRPGWLASFAEQQAIPYYGAFPRRGTDVGRR